MYLQRGPPIVENKTTTHRTYRTHRTLAITSGSCCCAQSALSRHFCRSCPAQPFTVRPTNDCTHDNWLTLMITMSTRKSCPEWLTSSVVLMKTLKFHWAKQSSVTARFAAALICASWCKITLRETVKLSRPTPRGPRSLRQSLYSTLVDSMYNTGRLRFNESIFVAQEMSV